MGEITTEKALGEAIQTARQAAGLTQQDLCHKAGLSYSTLAKIERGAIKTPSVFTVFKVAEVLKSSMDDLMGAVVDSGFSTTNKINKKISKSGVSFLYLDINGCLVQFFHAAFTKIAQDTGASSDQIETAFWHYNDAVCRGDIAIEDFNERFAKQIKVESIDWNKYYLDSVKPIEQMHELVKWASKYYKIGLLSNIMPGQIEAMIENGILPDVDYDTIIDSSKVQAIKPESAIYEIAQSKAGVTSPDQILFVDDSRTNLMAAERQGWKVMWFDDFQPQESAHKIKNSLEF